MSTIWIICGSLLIGTAIGIRTTTSTTPSTNTSDLPTASSFIASTFKPRRSLHPLNDHDHTLTSRLPVRRTSSFSPRISVVENTNNSPQKYSDTAFTNNFRVHNVDYHPKILQSSTNDHASHLGTPNGFKLISANAKLVSNPFHTSGDFSSFTTVSPMNLRHIIAMDTFSSSNLHSTFPNQFEDGKFSRLNNRPLTSNIGSPIAHSPINYSPTYPATKSILHNPGFASASLTNTGNFVPINLEQLQTSREIPERIHGADIELKPSYPTTFNKPNLYLSPIDNSRNIPIPLSVVRYPYPKVGVTQNYQLLSTQPQLLFTANSQQSPYQSQPFERIRTDVEVINKNRPSVTVPKDDDKSEYDDSDEAHSYSGEYHGTGQYEQATNYQVPSSPLFDSYDAVFGKYTKLSSDTSKNEKLIEKPERYNPNADKVQEQRVYQSQSDDTLLDSREKYEYGNEGESAPQERIQRDSKHDVGYNDELAHFDSYGKDFNHEFEKSYQTKLPIEKYAHVKEVPNVDESVNKEKIVSRGEKKRGSGHKITITSPKIESSHKIPRANHTRNKSIEHISELLTNYDYEGSNKEAEGSAKQFPSQNLNTATFFTAPINNATKARKHRELNS